MKSLMAGICSDVPSQGAPRENHHALPPGEAPGPRGQELNGGLGAPLTAAPRSPSVG